MDREEPMKPRVLVVEDDPVSRAFFREVLAGLPAVVDAAAGCDEAEACARAHPHVLWLVDAHLPDGGAVDLFPRLQASSGHAGAVGLAHTASRDPGVHASLLGAGFVDVLVKPVAASALLAIVQGCLRRQVREARATFEPTPAPAVAGHPGPAPWDDHAALAALGDAARVQALRALFASDLPAAVAQVDAALRDGNATAVRELLHRLASACAFTGATGFGHAVRRLHRTPFDDDAAAAFRHAAARVLSPRGGL